MGRGGHLEEGYRMYLAVCGEKPIGVQGVQNVHRSAWGKTDAASVCVSTDIAFAVLLAASVFTHALGGTFCIPCTPQVPTSGNGQYRHPMPALDVIVNHRRFLLPAN
jgi:hypothetical protein